MSLLFYLFILLYLPLVSLVSTVDHRELKVVGTGEQLNRSEVPLVTLCVGDLSLSIALILAFRFAVV